MTKRMFIALDISTDVQQKLCAWRTRELNLSYKAIPAKNLHLTLAFLGQVNAKQQAKIVSALDRLHNNRQTSGSPLRCKTTPVSFDILALFTKPQVCYLTSSTVPAWLSALASEILALTQAYPLVNRSNTYLPHISLYRKAKSCPLTMNCAIDIQFSSFSLYHSYSNEQGLCYQPVKSWSL